MLVETRMELVASSILKLAVNIKMVCVCIYPHMFMCFSQEHDYSPITLR